MNTIQLGLPYTLFIIDDIMVVLFVICKVVKQRFS